jgi:hypothetical protein
MTVGFLSEMMRVGQMKDKVEGKCNENTQKRVGEEWTRVRGVCIERLYKIENCHELHILKFF